MTAIRRDDVGKAKCRALQSRGYKHACVLRNVAGRLPNVVCKMIETGQTFDQTDDRKASPEPRIKSLDVRLHVLVVLHHPRGLAVP